MNSLDKKAKWRHIGQGHCAYRSKSPTLHKKLCNHLLSVTTDCQFSTCPIIQDKYISFQRYEDVVYKIEKDASKKLADMWTETELKGETSIVKKEVEKTLKKYSPAMAKLALRKYEYLAQLATEYKESMEEEEKEK